MNDDLTPEQQEILGTARRTIAESLTKLDDTLTDLSGLRDALAVDEPEAGDDLPPSAQVADVISEIDEAVAALDEATSSLKRISGIGEDDDDE